MSDNHTAMLVNGLRLLADDPQADYTRPYPHGHLREAADEIERLTRERDMAMNANMAKIAPFLPPMATGSTVAADTPAPMSYREVVAYAELLAAELRFQRENLPARQWPRIDAALAKNPNPIGTLNLSIDKQGREAENPSSGPVGLGPCRECRLPKPSCESARCPLREVKPAQGNACKDESECQYAPWCRIEKVCWRVANTSPEGSDHS